MNDYIELKLNEDSFGIELQEGAIDSICEVFAEVFMYDNWLQTLTPEELEMASKKRYLSVCLRNYVLNIYENHLISTSQRQAYDMVNQGMEIFKGSITTTK